MPACAAIAVIALGVAVLCAIAFMRVYAGIVSAIDGGGTSAEAQTAGWHLLHTPTRLLLRRYRAARPDGKLVAYLQAIYAVFGLAVIAFFATVTGLFR
jgi:hypothetical protein